MRRLSRDTWLAIGLFMAVAVLTALAALQKTQAASGPAYASFSSAADGTRALWLWLKELGYPVSNRVADTFQPPKQSRVILLLEPSIPVAKNDWQLLDRWVEAGGTLVLAGEAENIRLAFDHYAFNLKYLSQPSSPLTLQAPLLQSPPMTGPAPVQAWAYLETQRSDFITHLAVPSGPVVVSFARGQGLVILCATAHPFSNAGLKEAGNPPLALNLALANGQAGTIWFDEWHHGLSAATADGIGPENWLRTTPTGHALLYSALVILVTLVLGGQLFGRPVPLPKDIVRRAPMEYVTAVANLNRRAGHRAEVLRQYHHRLKRHLGQRYHLDPTLRDAEYVARLAQFKPDLNADALRDLLQRLLQRGVSESEMIALAAEVVGWTKQA